MTKTDRTPVALSLLALLLLACSGLTGCATAPPADPNVPTYELEVAGEEVTLSFHALPLGEFLKLAQEITRETYTFDSRAAATAGPFSLIGTVHCERAAFGDFVATMLRRHGWTATPHGEGDNRVILVQPAAAGKRT